MPSHSPVLYCLTLGNPAFLQTSAVSCLATLLFCSHHVALYCLVLGNPAFVQLSAVLCLATLVLCSHHAVVSCLTPDNPGFVQSPCSCQLSRAWQPWFCADTMQLSAVSCLATLVLCSHQSVDSCLTSGNPGFVQSPCSRQLSHAWHPCFFAGGAPGDGEQQRNPEASPEHHLLHGSQC